jgi:hypothetical protein
MSIGLATKGILSGVMGAGGSYPDPVPGCPPEQEADSVGQLHLDVDIIQEDVEDVSPGIGTTLLPDTPETREIFPTLRTFPLPKNL